MKAAKAMEYGRRAVQETDEGYQKGRVQPDWSKFPRLLYDENGKRKG